MPKAVPLQKLRTLGKLYALRKVAKLQVDGEILIFVRKRVVMAESRAEIRVTVSLVALPTLLLFPPSTVPAVSRLLIILSAGVQTTIAHLDVKLLSKMEKSCQGFVINRSNCPRIQETLVQTVYLSSLLLTRSRINYKLYFLELKRFIMSIKHLLWTLFLLSALAHAEVYKCRNAQDEFEYTDKPCIGETSEKMKITANNSVTANNSDGAIKGRTTKSANQDENACIIRGGKWTRGRGPHSRCVLPSHDGGKPCKNESECEFGCFAPGNLDNPGGFWPSNIVGQCAADNDPSGCKVRINNGKVVSANCYDY
jgi:hypothetical protein